MIDRAPLVAAYLVGRAADDAEPNELWGEMRRRWPGLSPEEGSRGARIAKEILAGTLAESTATRERIEAELDQRRTAEPSQT